MAGSRLEKYGTIFTRMRGLLQSNAIKEHDKPMWYDVYDAFPPHVEPKLFRPVPTDIVKPIFYPEDAVRAKFYSVYGSPGLLKLKTTDTTYKSVAQLFVNKYLEIRNNTKELTEEELFQRTEADLINEGVLKRRDETKKSVKPHKVVERERLKGTIDVATLMDEK